MRRLSFLAAIILVMAVPLVGFAGSDIPDITGTWVRKIQAVKHHRLPKPDRKVHNDVKTGHSEMEFTLTIDKQDGFRFSGTKGTDRRRERISGVIGFDNKTLYMVDDDGMSFCRLVSPDKMEEVYLHVTTWNSLAGRAILVRKR